MQNTIELSDSEIAIVEDSLSFMRQHRDFDGNEELKSEVYVTWRKLAGIVKAIQG